ncbi:MAG: divergent polysaccharide deacetylase family protein [Candidatus Omnitrophica bacterium]|nr:divergent polysaccharide deacetylase family protein [Candidatus Omnitrophota bacterium]
MADRRRKKRWVIGLLLVAVFGAGFLLGRIAVPSRKAPPPPRIVKARIAIVLDDWGYNLKQVPALGRIHQPLTVSVLPNLPFSTRVARAAHAGGHEVILHMPMEARDSRAPREAGTLLTRMSREEVLQSLGRSLATVPFARGLSNHQGSKGTADRALMETVLGDLKRRGLFFLDSRVTEESVCRQVAGRLNLRFAQRAVFLDNDKSPEAIRARLAELAKVAERNGGAVGIGHDRGATLQVLEERIPALEEAGYQFVPVSDLTEVPRNGARINPGTADKT